jgi:RND family efflux transporter MFP subunit
MDEQKRSSVLHSYAEGVDKVGAKQLMNNTENTEMAAPTRKQRIIAAPTEHIAAQPYPPAVKQPLPAGKAQVVVRRLQSYPRRVRLLGAILAGVVLLGIIGFTLWSIFFAVQPVTAFAVGQKQGVSENIGGGGIVYPKQQLNISYPISERVLNVLVNAGDHVNANQALIKLDPTSLNAQLTQASKDVQAAQAYLNSVSNATPYNPVTVAAAQQAYQVAQNRYNALLAQTSSSTLHNGMLVTPISGVVTVVNVNPGQTFAANSTLITIMDQSSVTVRAKIPLTNLGQVKLGQPAQVTPSALPNVNVTGSVSSIIPQADPQTDTFGVWVTINNNQQSILPGMSAFVSLQAQQSAFVVPRLAVLNPDRDSSVFVIHNGHAVAQRVHIVGQTQSSYFIDSGLTPGEQIVLLPLDKLHDGQQINVTSITH